MTSNNFSSNQKLCETDFTVEWLLNSLNKNDEDFKKNYSNRNVKNVTSRDISGGKGMFSIVLKCDITFEDSKNVNDIYTTILKIPGTQVWELVYKGKNVEEMEFGGMNIIDFIIKMHKTECNFYDTIGKTLPKILPKVFKNVGKHQGCLHMEDLSLNGKNLDFYNSLSHGQLKNIINCLAYFHKKIMCMEEKSWKGKFLEQKLIFVNIGTMIKDVSEGFLEMSNKNTALKTLYGHPKIQKMILNTEYIKYAQTQSHLDIGIPDLLVHSDLWSSNIMFIIDKNGNISNEILAILDWQVLHEGNMLLDFVRLMLNSLDGDTRREAELYIFDFYIDQLNKYLSPESKKAPYTVKQVKKAYEYMFIAHFIHSVMIPGAIFKSRCVKSGEERIEEARIDKCALRALNVLEDALILLKKGQFDEWLL